MKFLLAAVAAAVLAAIAATVYLGARLREETVVPDPYEAGLRWDAEHGHPLTPTFSPAGAGGRGSESAPCDLSAGPCARAAGSLDVTLEIAPHPIRAMTDLRLAARVREGGRPVDGAEVTVSFAMRGMFMGENRASLAPEGAGSYAGKAVLVRCPSGRGDWSAEVRVTRPGTPPASAAFDVRVAR